MNNHRDQNTHERKCEVVENCVADYVGCCRVGHHWRLAQNAHQAGTKDVRSVERLTGDDVNDCEPHHNCGGSDNSGVNSFTNGIVPLSHRSSSKVVSLAGTYAMQSALPSVPRGPCSAILLVVTHPN